MEGQPTLHPSGLAVTRRASMWDGRLAGIAVHRDGVVKATASQRPTHPIAAALGPDPRHTLAVDVTPAQTQRTRMASGSNKTTMGKINRERKLRERRLDKQSKKDARKQASTRAAGSLDDVATNGDGQSAVSAVEELALG